MAILYTESSLTSVEIEANKCRTSESGGLHCYFALNNLRSTDARSACPRGSYLAVVDTENEYHFLYNYVANGKKFTNEN